MTTARTFTALALTAALSPLLAACSDDAISAPPASAPTTAASSATPTPSASPDLSIAPPGETAQQFIERWIELGNRMQATGDTTDVLAVSGVDCSSCKTFASRVEAIYKDGGRIEGGSDTVLRMTPEAANQWQVDLLGEPTSVFSRDGKVKDRLVGGRYRVRLYLARNDGNWFVADSDRDPT